MLVSNDLVGTINEILLGRTSIEDIGTIYAKSEELDVWSASWEELNSPEKINERHYIEILYSQIEDQIRKQKLWDKKYYSEDNMEIYQEKVREILKKLIEIGKVIDIDKNNLPQLPLIEIDNSQYGFDFDESRNFANSKEEFCVKQLLESKQADNLKKYFPKYEGIIDEMLPLIEDIEKYVETYYSQFNNEIETDILTQELEAIENKFETKGIDISEMIRNGGEITTERLGHRIFEEISRKQSEKTSDSLETQEFYWQDKLDLFEDVYCSEKTIEELKKWIMEGNSPEYFKPSKLWERADELTAPDLDNPKAGGNAYYHLNGRNLLGIKRKWIEENGEIKSGITFNSGEITIDHSALTQRFLSQIFLEVKSKEELINTVKELLNLSNEEIVRKFNITSSKSDMANLFNAIVLDPVIDYEVERENFKRYGICWADSHLISIATKDGGNGYKACSEVSSDYDIVRPMEIVFPSGETITFKLNFVDGKDMYRYTLDDISSEILEVKGNSEILNKVVNQLDRFKGKEKREVSVSEIAEVAEGQTKTNRDGAMNAVTSLEKEEIKEGQSHNNE